MINDLRYGIRMFVKNPSSTVVVMLSLALGIGVNTTIFSFVNALLIRPPAVEAAEELLEIWNEDPKASSNFERYMPLSYPDYAYFRDNNQIFSHLLAFDGDPAFISWSRAGEGEMIQGQIVSGNFFSLLGVRAAFGRTFLPEEDQVPGTHPVIVLSYPFWKERLGGDPGVLGKAVTLNGQSFTVIGVAPQGFTGLLVGIVPAVWIPIMMAPQLSHDPEQLIRRGSHWLFAVGRLKPGVSRSHAKADVRLLADQIERAHPEARERLGVAVFPTTLVPGPYRGYVGAFTALLMVAVIFVLLIACANAASLLLARTTSRRHEIAIRSALGASRGQLIRQTLIESILLACASGAASLILTSWAVPLLLDLRPSTIPIRLDVPVDYRVLGFTLMISFLAGILFGIGPALQGTRFDLGPSLKDGTYSGASRRSQLHNLLVGGQVAACLVLLVGGGLCLRSPYNARSIDPGFEIPARLDSDCSGHPWVARAPSGR